MYSLASCEYHTMNGLSVASAAATSPARLETSSRPHRYASGMIAVPARTDSDLSPASPVPNTLAQIQPSTKYSGGFVSWEVSELSRAPKDRFSSCAAWASSNQ